MGTCKYSELINCKNRVCGRCGWNPVEDKRRKEKIANGGMVIKDGRYILPVNGAAIQGKAKRQKIDKGEVKRLCEEGKSVREIAESLGARKNSIHRVKKHMGMQGSMTRNKKYKVSKDGVEIARGTAAQCAAAIGVSTISIHRAYHSGGQRDGLTVEAL